MQRVNFLIILMILCLAVACESKEEDISKVSDGFLSKQVEVSNKEQLQQPYNNLIALKGNFMVRKEKSGQIGIYTETEDTRHVFVLDAISKSFLMPESFSKLVYLKDGLLLDDKYFLGVKGNVGRFLELDAATLAGNRKVKYYNSAFAILVYKKYSKNDNITKDVSSTNLMRTPPEAGLVDNCDSGGEGATSCSTGECSVSCGSGYYACCNNSAFLPDDCHCEVND